MKKLVLIFGFIAIIASIAGAGGDAEGGEAAESAAVNPEGVFPIVENTITLTALVRETNLVNDFENNVYTQAIEEKSNIRIDWNTVTQADYDTKLNLIIASGDYPDIFLSPDWSPTQIEVLANDGVLTPLTPYIEEYGENTRGILTRFPRLKKVLTMSDGNIYSIPTLAGAYHAIAPQKMWVNTLWMEALDLEMPRTTEEFVDMLIAFKTRDPNGNGEADEIPLIGDVDGWNTNVDPYLMSSFIYNDGDKRMLAIDGRITVSYDKPEWKEGLKYIKGIFDADLLALETFTQNNDQLVRLGENPGVHILGAVPAGWPGVFTQFGAESERWRDYLSIPPLEGPAGVRTTHYIADMGATDWLAGLALSSSCPYPAAAFRLGDLMYTEEFSMLDSWGIEGVDWERSAPGTPAVDGTPTAVLTPVGSELGLAPNTNWNSQSARYMYFEGYHSKRALNEGTEFEGMLYSETKKNYMPFVPDDEQIVPRLSFLGDEANEIVDIETQLIEYVNEMVARFVTGDVDIDDGWEAYLRELDNIGLERYIEIYQTSYDRIMK